LTAQLEGSHLEELFLLLFDVPTDGAELGRILGRVDNDTVFVDADGSPLADLEAFSSAAGEARFRAEGRLAGLSSSLTNFGLVLNRLDLSMASPGGSSLSITTTFTAHEDGLVLIQYWEARSQE
jgi:hypothetical protein